MCTLRRLALALVACITVVASTAVARADRPQDAQSAAPSSDRQSGQEGAPAKPAPTVATDKFAYTAGEVAAITGAGFVPGEVVLLRVGHVVGTDEGEAHLPFVTVSDGEGRIAEQWAVPSTDTGGRLLQLTAEGQSSGLVATSSLSATAIMIVDDSGPDDYPGQKDLNFFTFDYGLPGATAIGVSWGWDDTSWSGNNTGDACTLFDTDADGFANYSFCITVKGIPATFLSARMYACSDGRTDRCTQPSPVTGFLSTGGASVVANADPFGTAGSAFFAASHTVGNTCSTRPGCYTQDTVATATIELSDVGGTTARLLNVCSYPSQVPNSDPSECVVTANNGFLTIRKEATPNDGTQFTFNLGAGQQAQDGTSQWTIAGSGQQAFISIAPGASYDLSEVVPATWLLSGASCVLQASPTASTGTFTTPTVSDFEIRSGLETICTFTNGLQPGSLTVTKNVVNDNGGTKGVGDFSFQVNGGPATAFESDGTNVISVAPGTYTVTEPAVAGYTTTYGNCTSVSVTAGGTATCTITNDDQPGTLVVTKTVVNNSGGTKTATDFSFQVNGGAAVAFEADGGNSLTVNAGTYTVTEPAVAGYTASYTNCSNLSIPNGGSATCAITNTDQAATLIIEKVVVNDNGGVKIATEFSFQVNAGTQTAFLQDGTDTLKGRNTLSLGAGAYTVTEPNVPGYSTSYTNCSDIVLVNGGTATCTITNDDAKAAPGGPTVQSAVLHDSVTLTGIRAGAPDAASATATFRLYSDAACTVQVGTAEERVLAYSGGGTQATAATLSGVLVSGSNTYLWRMEYSGDRFNAGFVSGCGEETTALTFVQ
jgi:hypothetical protein